MPAEVAETLGTVINSHNYHISILKQELELKRIENEELKNTTLNVQEELESKQQHMFQVHGELTEELKVGQVEIEELKFQVMQTKQDEDLA